MFRSNAVSLSGGRLPNYNLFQNIQFIYLLYSQNTYGELRKEEQLHEKKKGFKLSDL